MLVLGCGGQVQPDSARPSDASGSASSAGGAGQGSSYVSGGSATSSAGASLAGTPGTGTGGIVTTTSTSVPPLDTNLVTMTPEEWDKLHANVCAGTTVENASLSCTYSLPTGLPYDGIYLVYEVGAVHDNALLILRACYASCPEINGWYLDSSAPNQTTIDLCPSTCERIRQDANAAVEILLECHTGPTIL
jgi:hypothetical protein